VAEVSTGATVGAADRHARKASLDVVRGLAALCVLLGHVHILDAHSPTAGLGNFVLLFFPLSGFLVAGPFLRSLAAGRALPSVRGYALRRFARILPAYWLVLLAVAVVLPTMWRPEAWWGWPLHFSLMQSLVPDEGNRVLLVAWSLSIEALFYICVPVLAVLAVRRARDRLSPGRVAAAILTFWLLSAVWNAVAFALGPVHSPGVIGAMHFSLLAYLCAFCPGMLIAVAESRGATALGGPWAWYRRLVAHPGLVALCMAVVWIPGLPNVNLNLPVPPAVAANLYLECGSIGSGLALALMLHPPAWLGRATRPLAAFGVISYGVYLWHIVLIELIAKHAHFLVRAGWPVLVPVVLIASVALGTASWVFVEKPAIAWANRRFARTAAAPAQQEVVGHAAAAHLGEPAVETAGTA